MGINIPPLHRALLALGLLAATTVQALPPGTPDPDFGQGGYLTNDFFGTDESVHALATLPDGRFVAAGVVTGRNAFGPGTSDNMAIARYLPNGTLDPAFGSGGLVHIDIDTGPDEANAIQALPDGSLLLAGFITTNAYSDFGLVKLLPDGRPDDTFGEDYAGIARTGYVRLGLGGLSIHDQAFALATQSDGRIIVAGVTRVVRNGFLYAQVLMARFTAVGVLDTTFGAGAGYVVLPPFYGDVSDVLTGIALTPSGRLAADDRITVVGYSYGRNSAFIARLTPDGAADPTFGNGSGRITLQASSSGGVHQGVSTIAAARLDANGRIVIAGQGSDRGITLMRFSSAGVVDGTFGNNGRSLLKFSASTEYDAPAALAIQGNGKIVAVGYATNYATGAPRKDFFVVRALPDGAPDSGFGDGAGRVVTQIAVNDDEAFAIAIEPSGNLLVGGQKRQTSASNAPMDYALLRLVGDQDRIFRNGFDGQ